MKQLRKIFFALLLFVTNYTFAAEWFPLPGAKGMEMEIDLNSIVPAGNGLIKAWIMQSFDENKASKDYPIFYYKSSMQLSIFNCEQRTSDVIQHVFYSEQKREGEVVKTASYPRKDSGLVDVVPGSVGEGALDFACQWVKRKKKK